jgi:hypothetical protein
VPKRCGKLGQQLSDAAGHVGEDEAVEFARFLGLEFTGRANITDIVNAVCTTAAHTRVELVCVDELHNLNLATRSGAEVSDQLKYFAERLPATFIYAGIDV